MIKPLLSLELPSNEWLLSTCFLRTMERAKRVT